MAISYAAQSADGRKIFLKQYKSPSPTVVWYGAFVDYQQELAARVRAGLPLWHQRDRIDYDEFEA